MVETEKGDPYPWMSYPEAYAFEPEAARLRVSTVARRAKGFMREYEKAATTDRMRDRQLPSGVVGGATWGQKRRTVREAPYTPPLPGPHHVGIQTGKKAPVTTIE